jgi:YHS domain-containing protein
MQYGPRFTARYVSVMVIAIVIAALIVNGIFSAVGLVPTGLRPLRSVVFADVRVDYKLFLNAGGLALFFALFWLTVRRGVTDPVCGMVVDRAKSVKHPHGVHVHHFCCGGCRDMFVANPEKYIHEPATPGAWAAGNSPRC